MSTSPPTWLLYWDSVNLLPNHTTRFLQAFPAPFTHSKEEETSFLLVSKLHFLKSFSVSRFVSIEVLQTPTRRQGINRMNIFSFIVCENKVISKHKFVGVWIDLVRSFIKILSPIGFSQGSSMIIMMERDQRRQFLTSFTGAAF